MPLLSRDPATGNIVKNGVVNDARTAPYFQTDLSVRHEFKVSKAHENWRAVLEGNAYNLLNQHPADFINHDGILYRAREHGMGVVTMRTLTSGIFQKLMRQAFPETAAIDWEPFLLNFVLSNPMVDVALTGMRRVEEVERNNAVSEDVGRRIDLEALHVRHFPPD